MFSDGKKSKSKTAVDYTNEQNKISKGTTFTGDVEAEGCFRIEGVLKGNLVTKAKVVISQSGRIEGAVQCGDADIEGCVEGTLTVHKMLNLKSTCVIEGEVFTGQMSVEPGAVLNGTCTMKGKLKAMDDEKGSGKKEKSA